MNRLKCIHLCCAAVLCCGMLAMGQSPIYPFDVIIGGQKAAVEGPSAAFAVLAEPVGPDAILEVQVEAPMVIINAFPCDDSGTPLSGGTPAVILIQGGNRVSLSKTLDGKKLKPGTYVANIVAGGKTARVRFEIK